MSLPNRVAPDGSLHAVAARGMFTGNRGIIHDPLTKTATGRRWTTTAWIACALQWKGTRRDVWGRNREAGSKPGWSELFFLDEVTALAAGHRPCFACRRADAVRFEAAFADGNKLDGCNAKCMDKHLHRERLLSARAPAQLLVQSEIVKLPAGAIIETGGGFLALRDGKALRWDFHGYGPADLPDEAELVTPQCVVNALRAGYRPLWHPSAHD
jgi:hypothetical protein